MGLRTRLLNELGENQGVGQSGSGAEIGARVGA
jgi:hypothetical protein